MEMKSIAFKSENSAGDGVGVLIGNPSACSRGLVLVHEWWGMTRQIQEVGAQIAGDGQLTVLVCDVYRGKIAVDHEHAGHYMHDLDWDGALKDISAAAKYLLSAGCTKVNTFMLYRLTVQYIFLLSYYRPHAKRRRYNLGRFCLSVCLSVCQTITFENLHVGTSYLYIRSIYRQYGSSSYMKVIGSRSRSQEPQTSKMSVPTV